MTATYEELREAGTAAWAPFDQPSRTLVRVNLGTCSMVVGAPGTLEALRGEVQAGKLDADILAVGCFGLCYAEPLVQVTTAEGGSVYYGGLTADKVPVLVQSISSGSLINEMAIAVGGTEPLGDVPAIGSLPFMREQMRRLMANCGVIDPENIEHYIGRGGYEGLSRALRMEPEAVITAMLDSGLWGRGGAAFPTGRKWDFLRGSPRHPKYVIVNADEGDPGAFVNRNIMESDPHLLVEGIVIAGFATNADRAFVYIRDEYPLPVARMEKAIEDAYAKGLLGKNILGSGFDFDAEVVRGAGSYVCGDETGLLSSLEDRRGMPKIKPPFPAEAGAMGQPSNINNVESYANAPLILRHGSAWWAAQGTENNKGTKMFSLSGKIQRVGILEVPLGTPTSEVVMEMGGGPPPGKALKAVQSGGPLSGVIPASEVEIPLEPEFYRERGSLMGAGGLVILDEDDCVVDLCIYFQWFAEDESCGRCTTCFAGTRRALEILRRIASGRGREADLELLKLLGRIATNANCFHGQGAPTVIASTFRYFEEELLEHVVRKRCPTKRCAGLIRYEVLHQSDRLPYAEAICPTRAVVRGDDGNYRIDQEKCIKCNACKEEAPYAIAIVDEFGA
ncbi:MAG TPA: NADH-ubiquinone oxidoreductase-F iron-sulfur binding region domain-containing protein [Dehalococcoidia bacterium]|nr:NADH-ubiquinone oxidoreductase-F iron-sulfur binding region domain-containing protein [Dehalococcoidia bacterium]